MLFNSPEFLIFGTLFFALWPIMRRGDNRRWVFITLMSLFFYGWWDWRYTFLFVATGLIDFFAGYGMVRWPSRRKLLLVTSLTANIGMLGFFKYLDFGLRNATTVLHWFGMEAHLPALRLILPVGISFYTFQSMSYTIDIYRGRLQPTRSVLHFFTSLSMFPHLVAGPIMRAADLQPQLVGTPRTTDEQKWDGTRLIVEGFFKKVVIADNLAPVVNRAFTAPTPLSHGPFWWVIMVMFAFQIYCDFSGYSDIARGLAKWMGYEFNLNFDHPYISASASEFWRRWHISLSSWFRDYVYIPLGGSRAGSWKESRNLWITMLVSGLWHGANWTFITWGALHALYLSIEKWTNWPARLAKLPGGRFASQVIVFLLVVIAWVFFRADTFSQAIRIIGIMLDVRRFHFDMPIEELDKNALVFLVLIALRQLWVALAPQRARLAPRLPSLAVLEPAVFVALILGAVYLRGPGSAFIYFQF